MVTNKSQKLSRAIQRALPGGAMLVSAVALGGAAHAYGNGHGHGHGGPHQPPPEPVTFSDIAQNPATGISYRRTESDTEVLYDALKIKPYLSQTELVELPAKTRGAPGVVMFDYDRDGDQDLFVTNGPGTPHSLFSNQLVETGFTTFVDVAAAAGVSATSQDGTGSCYGDVDNDGDEDLLVLGRMEPARFFENNGDGTFTDRSAHAGVSQGARAYTSCAMGDVDNDGLLDVFVSNTFDWSREEAIFSDLFSFSHTNELWHNDGGNSFSDVSATSGVLELFNVPPGDGTITWASGFVDFDQDGDLDIIQPDDQAAIAPREFAGYNRGIVHILANDGTGHFTDVTGSQGINHATSWMGVSFGDVNCDGEMDYFAVSLGDYAQQQFGFPIPAPINSSQWFLGSASGQFSPPGLGGLVATPFGWGNGMADYDNDADTDIIYYGNIDLGPFVSADNPGVVLRNEGCTGAFTWDEPATAHNAEYVKRQAVEGVALGDLNNDGFVDVAWVAGQYAPPSVPLTPTSWKWGGPFDKTADILPTFAAIGPLEWEWMGAQIEDGFFGVEINSASNGNDWVKIEVLGSKGLTTLGAVNRDGIGAIVKFKPKQKPQLMASVGGSGTYSSQHSLIQGFGLGNADKGRAEVLWPGGTRTRLYDVDKSEHVLIPEIPCDFSASWPSKNHYRSCVSGALGDLENAGVLSHSQRNRLESSALRAYDDAH